MNGLPCILVGHSNLFKPGGGGVQLCTREHISLLEAAGFTVHKLEFEFDNSPLDRAARYFSIARGHAPGSLHARLVQSLKATGARHVFFGLNLFENLSRSLRRDFPRIAQILLSHGVEAVDVLIAHRLGAGQRRSGGDRKLGSELIAAAAQRQWIDGVVALSPFEVEIEKWLGTKACHWTPATISAPPLEMTPADGRVGYVSTLDHPPNVTGLIQLLKSWDIVPPPSGFELRLAGQPQDIGVEIAASFPMVRYLGALSDDALRREAATWCSFLNPILVGAKGRSTKIGQALGWRLPIATTSLGVRGYVWDQTVLPTPDTVTGLAQLAIEQSCLANFSRHRKMTEAMAAISPRLDAVAQQLRDFIQTIEPAVAEH